MSDTHKVMTHLLSCYVQSVVVKYYLQFHGHIFLHVELFIELNTMWCMSCLCS